MGVQFNLLPDVKLEFNRSVHTKRMIYSISALVTLVAVAIFAVSFFSVDVLQKKLLNDANNDITTYSKKIKSIPQIEQILTVQNQLSSLPALHQKKHIASRLFDYLPQVTPAKVSVGKLTLDTTANTIEFEGTADTVENINTFVDTLKFTTYQATAVGSQTGNGASNSSSNSASNPSSGSSQTAFSNVVLTKIDRDDKGASYTIDASFNPALFDASLNVVLTVPNEITTRSVLDAPSTSSPLFNGQTQTKSQQQQGAQ